MIKRRTLLQGTGTLLLGAGLLNDRWARAAQSSGQLLYGYPPGAIGNHLADGVLPLLASQGGPNYKLVNIEGHNTRTASEDTKKAPADGTVLLQVLSSSFTLQPNVYNHIDFDPIKDFEPIALLGDLPFSLTVGPAVPSTVNSLSSFVAWVRDNPDYRNIGVSVYGSLAHMALRVTALNSAVPLRGQPYNGTAAMLADLNNQSLAAAFTAVGNHAGKNANGALRSIGVTSRERLKYWPQVPTLYEQGLSDMDITGWFGWFAPAGTPASVTQPLRERIRAMQAQPGYGTLQQSLLLTQVSMEPAQIQSRIRQESAQFAHLVSKYPINRID